MSSARRPTVASWTTVARPMAAGTRRGSRRRDGRSSAGRPRWRFPLTSIKYAAGENRRWGINFGRSRRRTLEFSSWAGPLDSRARVSQAGSLTGLTLAAPAAAPADHPVRLYAPAGGQLAPTGRLGIDARYALTPQTAVYATVNPDFATIEADQEQINLTRFEVSLPEKRQFFLEGKSCSASGSARSTRGASPTSLAAARCSASRVPGPWPFSRSSRIRLDGLGTRQLHGRSAATRCLRTVERGVDRGEPQPGGRQRGVGQRRHQPLLHQDPQHDGPGGQELGPVQPRHGRRSTCAPPTIHRRATSTSATRTSATGSRTT